MLPVYQHIYSRGTTAFMVSDYCLIHRLRTQVKVAHAKSIAFSMRATLSRTRHLTQTEERVPWNAHILAAIQAYRSKPSLRHRVTLLELPSLVSETDTTMVEMSDFDCCNLWLSKQVPTGPHDKKICSCLG